MPGAMTENPLHLNASLVARRAEGDRKPMLGHHRLDHFVYVLPERIGALDAAVFVFYTAALADTATWPS